jgi:uncharacterized beta-barrel protein YwiB (DUF1934 family)
MSETETISENSNKFLFIKKQEEVLIRLANTDIPVKITVKTTIDQDETFELTVFGRYYQKERASFLHYVEVTDEGDVTTIVKVSAEDALILRSGALKMRLPFRLHEKLTGSYEMPFGVFETTTMAKKMEHSYQQGLGAIDIVYDFAMHGASGGTYRLEITFQEDKK